MTSNELFTTPDHSGLSAGAETEPVKRGWLLVSSSILLSVLNFVLALAVGTQKYAEAAEIYGYALSPMLFAALIVGLFQFGKRYRNPRSRIKIYCWTSLITLFSSGNQLFKIAATSVAG